MAYYLVFLEQRDGFISNVAVDVWNRVQQEATQSGDKVSGFVAGPLKPTALADLYGNGTIYHASDEALALPSSTVLCRILTTLVAEEACSDIVIGATVTGKRLAPCLAEALHASLLGGCTGGSLQSGLCRRYIYSGLVLAAYQPAAKIRIFLQGREQLRSAFMSPDRPHCVFFDAAPFFVPHDNLFIRSITAGDSRRSIAEANIIVAGGRGMGGKDQFVLLEELASLLGGGVGASRSAVDEGWRPHSDQIGQTGKSVAPDLYIACGISGAVQHLAGLSSARTVVAVNSDPHAPIFDAADYGIVGDVREVIPALIEEVKEVLEKK